MFHAVHSTTPDVEALPPTQPIELPVQAGHGLRLERTGFDSYTVCDGDEPVGFVDVVGRIHVVYLGRRADRAVEVAQTLDLGTALDRLAAAR
ncbi:hypothetical protein [Microbacterium sp. GXF7504]